MARQYGNSLKRRIAAVASLLFLLGIGLITFFVTRILHDDMREMLFKQQLTTVSYIAQDINGKIKLRLDSLQRVALKIPPEYLSQPKQLQDWLEQRHAIHLMFPTGMMVIPPDGGPTIAEAPRLASRPKSFADRDWFIKASTTRQPAISKPLIARATNEASVVIAVPILDSHGKLQAILAGVTPLATPGFLDLIQSSKLGKNGRYQVISPEHDVYVLTSDANPAVSRLPKAGIDESIDLARTGKRGVFIARSDGAEDELIAIAEVPTSNWLLLARQSRDEAFEPVSHSVRNSLLITTLLGIPLLAVLFSALSHLLMPFAKLAEQLREMTDGTRLMEPVSASVMDEVADVANSFNGLQRRILEQEKRLADLAHHDPLTGLPNRLKIIDRLESELLRIRRSGAGLALLFLDLDRFKPVNDDYGHQVGDHLLRQIAQRLQACVRDVDTVARLGGDEFLILLSDSEAPLEAAERVAQHCIDALSIEVRVGDLRLTVGVSIGIVVTMGKDAAGVTAAQLSSFADIAMYRAKSAGRGRYAVYTPD